MDRRDYSIDRLSVKLLYSCIHQAQGMWECGKARAGGSKCPKYDPWMRIKLSVQIQAEETNKPDQGQLKRFGQGDVDFHKESSRGSGKKGEIIINNSEAMHFWKSSF